MDYLYLISQKLQVSPILSMFEFLKNSCMVFKELQLQTSGIKIEVIVISVSIRGFICEAPTRSFLKCITGHN